MGKYIKLFDTHTEYEAYTADTSSFILPNVSYCIDTPSEVHYNPVLPHDYSQDYFTMVITTSGDIKWGGSTSSNTLSYSKDNGDNWTTADSSTTISVEAGDKVLWKGTPKPSHIGIGNFSGANNVRYYVEGNAMSLLFGDNFKGQTSLSGKDYAFYCLFRNNTNITSAKNLSLPATTLAIYCYVYMFENCTSLTTAPELPATTLVNGCYEGMFSTCTSLTTAPELPATTLGNECYQTMFSNCTSLTTAPELPATTLVESCYRGMFEGCRSLNSIISLATDISASNCTYTWVTSVATSGTFTKAASMSSWSTGNNGIPTNWTVVDAA